MAMATNLAGSGSQVVSATSAQPRIGFSHLINPSGTVIRASYSRTFETPYNENLILSSATGVGGLASNAFGAVSKPLSVDYSVLNSSVVSRCAGCQRPVSEQD